MAIQYVTKEICKQSYNKKLFVTGASEIPILVWNGNITNEIDMRTSHEEADINIVQLCFNATASGCSSVKVLSDDTDVFVLLAYFYHKLKCSSLVYMEATHGNRSVIDIKQTIIKWPDVISVLPAVHAITGCHSTSRIFGIGKKTALKYCKIKPLIMLGDLEAPVEDVINEASEFIGYCYGQQSASMTDKRLRQWLKKSSGKLTSPTKLCSSPPTSDAFKLHVLRSHYQCAL